MFKIVFGKKYTGSLDNGISIGMRISDAMKIDDTLSYNDLDEDYSSKYGYWLETGPESESIISISIFIKELPDEETFFKYEW